MTDHDLEFLRLKHLRDNYRRTLAQAIERSSRNMLIAIARDLFSDQTLQAVVSSIKEPLQDYERASAQVQQYPFKMLAQRRAATHPCWGHCELECLTCSYQGSVPYREGKFRCPDCREFLRGPDPLSDLELEDLYSWVRDRLQIEKDAGNGSSSCLKSELGLTHYQVHDLTLDVGWSWT